MYMNIREHLILHLGKVKLFNHPRNIPAYFAFKWFFSEENILKDFFKE
jgi:hypothetical protein